MRDRTAVGFLVGGLGLLTLFGCGGGGASGDGGGGGGGGGSDPLRQVTSFDDGDVGHLLTRTSFAATPEARKEER